MSSEICAVQMLILITSFGRTALFHDSHARKELVIWNGQDQNENYMKSMWHLRYFNKTSGYNFFFLNCFNVFHEVLTREQGGRSTENRIDIWWKKKEMSKRYIAFQFLSSSAFAFQSIRSSFFLMQACVDRNLSQGTYKDSSPMNDIPHGY